MSDFRIETDSMGELQVPSTALYGAQTQRAVNNFKISGRPMPVAFIQALALVKRAAASTNQSLALLPAEKAEAIIRACHEVESGQHDHHFPVDIFQTGSGTSSNMNANEVIATLANQYSTADVHPNDDVNMGQSSNDVIPTTIHVSTILELKKQLLPALSHLSQTILSKASTVESHIKTGRTHLMDAMPVSLAQELSGWATQIDASQAGIEQSMARVQKLAQGGTAVGTGINAHPDFSQKFADTLSELTDVPFQPNDNLFMSLSSQDAIVALSGQLKTLAVSLMKIANDLRWMNSGPLAGLGEIELEALQPGSSIMPGKVNPVIPEAVAMVSAQVIGNDAAITVAGQSGNFQLNVMLPLVGQNILDSISLLANASHALADKAIASFHVNEENLQQALSRNPILVTALNPVIGYAQAAKIAKMAYAENAPIIDVAERETDLDRETLQHLLNPAALAQGGIQA